MTCSYRVTLELVCDACGRRESYEWDYYVPCTDAIYVARKKGWMIGQYAICQSCKDSDITWRDVKKATQKVGGIQ